MECRGDHKAIDTGETRQVDVARRLRVSILYFTSFVDEDGTIESAMTSMAATSGCGPFCKARADATVNAKAKPGVI